MIQKARQGDLDSFNQLVLAYQDLVFHHTYATLGEPELAEDITQEVFIKAYRNLTGFRGGSLRAWLLRIAANACYDEFRRRKKKTAMPMLDVDLDDEALDEVSNHNHYDRTVEMVVEQAELQAAIQRGLADLPAEYRMATVIVDLLGFDYAEAATSLGVPLGTVKSRLARARQGLRKYLNGVHELAY